MIKVFVIILNWNRAEDTISCIKSLARIKKTGFHCTNVIVDNGSTDDSLRQFEKMDVTPKPLIVKTLRNLGFAGGNNIGIKYALARGADYVLILNNDTIVEPNLISGLIEKMEEDTKIGAMSPKIYFAKGFEFHKKRYKKSELGRVIWYAGGRLDWANVYGENLGVDEVDRSQDKNPVPTDFATGACMLLRTRALAEAGIFDERYSLYLEDCDLSLRIKAKGWKIMYYPEVYLWHKVAQSSGIGSNLNDYYLTRNRLLFGLHYAPLRTKIALFKESIKFLISGRPMQKAGVRDFYLGKFGKASI